MLFIKTAIKLICSFALIISAFHCSSVFSNTSICITVSLTAINAYFLYSFFFKKEEDGSTFAFFPVWAAYTKDQHYTVFYKFVWLEKVHYRYYDGKRKYNTESLWRYKY